MKYPPALSKRNIIIGTWLLCILFHILYIPYNQVCGDEPFSIFYAHLAPMDIIHELMQGNNPPVYELFLHFWMKLFGYGYFSVRLFSVLLMTLGWLAFIPIAKVFKDKRLLILLPLVFTFTTLLFVRNIEARMYPLFFALVLWSWAAFLQLYQTRNIFWGVILALSSGASLYAHYLGVFHFITIGFTALLFTPIRRPKKVVMSLLAILISSPILFLIFYKSIDYQQDSWLQITFSFKNIFYNFMSLANSVVVIAGLLVSWLFYIFYKKERLGHLRKNFLLILLLYIAIVYTFMWVASAYGQPVILGRYLGFIAVASALLIAISVLQFWNKYKILSIGILLLLIIRFDFTPWNHRNCKTWTDHAKNAEAVVITPKWCLLPFVYHQMPLLMGTKPENIDDKLRKKGVYPVYSAAEIPDSIERAQSIIYLDLQSKNDVYPYLNKNRKVTASGHLSDVFSFTKFEEK